MMGLRLAEELPWTRLEQESGRARDRLFDANKIGILRDEGYLEVSDTGIIATRAGRQRLNALLSYLLRD